MLHTSLAGSPRGSPVGRRKEGPGQGGLLEGGGWLWRTGGTRRPGEPGAGEEGQMLNRQPGEEVKKKAVKGSNN